MNDSPQRVSVVITCYNYAHFLDEAIQSCFNQTLQPQQVVVVDDGSEDDTRAVAARYAGRVEYAWQPNGGLSAARNKGASLAAGDFVVFLDADDMLCETYLERCATVLASSPPDIAFVYTAVRYFGAATGTSRTSPFDVRTLRYSNYVNASAMIRREVLDRFHYAEELPALEDFDFYLTLAEHGLNGVRVPEPLLLYRKHNSMSDRMTDRWNVIHRMIIDRHPVLYPARVRVAVSAFRFLDRWPLLSRASWVLRAATREARAKLGGAG